MKKELIPLKPGGMMKVSTMGLCVALLATVACIQAQEEVITIQSDQGTTFTVPRSLINAPALLAWFKKNNHALPNIKGFLPLDMERKVIKQEQATQKTLACKIRLEKDAADLKAHTLAHYLATGEGKAAVSRYSDAGFSVKQLMEHNSLHAQPMRRSMTINKNVIKIQTLTISNQLINNLEGLETIEGINRFALIDLSDNRIANLNFESLNRLHDQLRFPMTIELRGNSVKLTKEVREQLAQLPMISILV